MPSSFDEPTVSELLTAFGDGIRARRDRYVDAREGAIYDHWGGAAAILWSRNARRDTDLWRAIYLDSAESRDLTILLEDRYDFERVSDTYGVGTTTLRRATTTAADGTVWKGSRIATLGSNVQSKRYVVSKDTPVSATDLTVIVPIRAEQPGPGTAISLGTGSARVDDPLWDPTWTVDSVTCADGTSFEPAAAARARLRDARKAVRPGFVAAIIQACIDTGAANALLFPSDFGGDAVDFGLNMAYVGDAGFQGDATLCRKVTLALEGSRVLGDQLQVLPMTRSNAKFSARVHLWDSPTRVNQGDVVKRLTGAILGYFSGGTNGFSYSLDAMRGALMKASPEVQFVEIDTPSSDAGVLSLVNGILNFPAVLPRYFLAPTDITLSLLPPL